MKNIGIFCCAVLALTMACNSESNREEELNRKERELVQKENELILKQQQQALEEKELDLMAKEEALEKREARTKQEQRYQTLGSGSYPESSTRLLTYDDIRGLTNNELTIMRNEIFARHGYAFKTPWLLDHFSQFSWYRPLYSDVGSQLSEIERSNVRFIKQYEQ